MKITASKDFGNKKPLLPLVPEPTKVARKEDLAMLDLLTNPTDPDSVKVKFAFKMLNGGNETVREIIAWRANVERALSGLHDGNGLIHYQLVQQFCRGTALSNFNTSVTAILPTEKAKLVAAQQALVTADDGSDVARAGRLTTRLTELQLYTKPQILSEPNVGSLIVAASLHHVVQCLMPSKVLQRVKRYLRREARKPADMGVKAYYMHLIRINQEEIPRMPPYFDNRACLSADEITDILLFGTPKSWQREMDRQGFDPMNKSPDQVVTFMEQIETSEDFDPEKKTNNNNKDTKKGAAKKKANNKNDDGSFYCMMHGNNTTHDTSDCISLKAQVKKMKSGNEGSAKNGKSKNKTWKNKSEKGTADSKKELAALTKQVQDLSKQLELNAIEPVKKRKVKWPSEEEEAMDLAAIDAELKEFNYGDLDKLDIKDDANEEMEDGEVASISDEVSV